jgi:hypothetical protein
MVLCGPEEVDTVADATEPIKRWTAERRGREERSGREDSEDATTVPGRHIDIAILPRQI